MASETMADIIAEIRAYGAQPPPRLMWLEIADRIESAWKRERAEVEDIAKSRMLDGATIVDNRSCGNAAAMRKALEYADEQLRMATESATYGDDVVYLVGCMRAVAAVCRAALSAPARNCDRFRTKEDARAFFDDFVCLRSNGSGAIECKGCPLDSIDNPHRADCREAWLLASAAERKGE